LKAGLVASVALAVSLACGCTVADLPNDGVASGKGGSGGATSQGGAGGAASGCGAAWEIDYSLTGTFSVTDALLGNGENPVGPGTMKIRFEDVSGAPGGKAAILSFQMQLMFSATNAGATVDTNVTANVPADPCHHATGTVIANALHWDPCTYGPTWNTGQGKWLGDANTATGPGCLDHYAISGNVHCKNGVVVKCGGNLQEGDNPQMASWSQPLNGFELAPDFKSFTMAKLDAPAVTASIAKGVEVPTAQPNRTWLTLQATETARAMVAKPCSCP
jgi:hypothetical protein